MAEKKISYTNRTFSDYRTALMEYAKENYPELYANLNDADVGSFFIDLMAAMGDNLGYYIDRALTETNVETAQKRSSLLSLAKSRGLKIPGPRGAMAEEKFTCDLPVVTDRTTSTAQLGMPDWNYAPVLRKGTRLSSQGQIFELLDDVDFSHQFSDSMVSDRTIKPKRDSNGNITKYEVSKYSTVTAGESKVYSQVITASDVKPFMEVIIPDTSVMGIESIIFKDGTNQQLDPTMGEFMNDREFVRAQDSPSGVDTYRFFETESLGNSYRWGDAPVQTRTKTQTYGFYDEDADVIVPSACVVKGEWRAVTQKFVTEYTDRGYLKVTFGGGETVGQQEELFDGASEYSKFVMQRMIANNFLGKTPKAGTTMYILYRRGGGVSSNLPEGSISTISLLNMEMPTCLTSDNSGLVSTVKNSIRATNVTPSISGKDAPSEEEIRNLIKYNNGSQERCVTLKDYEARTLLMPSRYGVPFRVHASEENNKIMLYLLGIDSDGKLSTLIPELMVNNIMEYLAGYRCINDYIEAKAGRIVNVSAEATIYVERSYPKGDVVKSVISTIRDYMDINGRQLGEDIFVGDLEKEIGRVDGVVNLVELKFFNLYGNGYSSTISSQATVSDDSYGNSQGRAQIDLDASDYILKGDADEMFEIKYPERDITVSVKVR